MKNCAIMVQLLLKYDIKTNLCQILLERSTCILQLFKFSNSGFELLSVFDSHMHLVAIVFVVLNKDV